MKKIQGSDVDFLPGHRCGTEKPQNQFPGEPPKWPQTCLKSNQNPYRVFFIEDIQAFPGSPKQGSKLEP